MDFDYKNILIYGYSKSGKAVENVLKDIGVKYKIYDEKIKVTGGEFISKLNKAVLKTFDLIVISPGVSIYSKYLKIADKMHIKIISELEFGFWFTTAEIIAVTGTNGKTTTTKMINEVLNIAGYKSGAYGNIGTPLSSAYGVDLDYIVCEVSSFQLEATDKFVSKFGVLLNISEDHINRHKNLDNYIKCKMALFKNNCNSDNVIIGNNDEFCDKISKKVIGNVITFGNNGDITCKDNKVYLNGEKIFEISKKLKEYTYIDNILAVIAVMKAISIPYEILNKINTQDRGEHRLELVLSHQGVDYIDDSKATNIHSVEKALDSVKGNIILLLGGQDKGLNFKKFVENLPEKISTTILFGECGKKLSKLFKKHHKRFACFKTLKMATEYALTIAIKGSTVLLSPACASFDEFSSYAERGDVFKNIVWSRLKG